MKDPKDLPPDFADLRRQAEALLAAEAIPPEDLSPDQATRLIHELRLHQIELEMQNDELRRSQAILKESRTKYAELYDFAPVGYLTLDHKGRIVEANLPAATLLGVERSKLLNRFFTHFLVEADRRVFRQLMNKGPNLPERRGEFHLQDGGGNVRVMLLDILFLTDAEGQERRRVSLTDITELKHTQEELRLHKEELEELVTQRVAELIEVNEQLRQANEQLEALFRAAPLAIAAFDADGRVTKINPACERLYGWSPEEVQGRLPRSIPKESPEESLAVLQRVLNGESVAGEEIKQQRQDGSLFEALVFGASLRDAQGKVRGFVGLAEDITERKKLEEETRTQARVLASMAEGVTVTDSRGTIIYTNPAFDALFGYKPGELVGRHSNLLNFPLPEGHQGIVKKILDKINTTGRWRGEFHNCKKDGKPLFTMAHISTVTVGGKKLYVSVQEDITQRKRILEQLQRQAELLDLAHDAILVWDTKGRITYWNQGAAHHYGWDRAEAMGQISHKLLQTVFPKPLMEIERQVMEHGFWEGELTHTTRQGRTLVMNSRWTAKRDEEGRIVAILEINQDVTAQKQIEQEVHRLASFPLLNPNPVLEVDKDGQILYANPAARHAAEELRLRKGMKAFLPPDLKEKFVASRQGGPRQYAFDLPLKDRVYAVYLSFPHDLPTARVYALDITDRQRAEAALRKSEECFRKLVEANIVGIVVSDEDKIVEANDEFLRMVGYAREELLEGKVKWVDMTPRQYIPKDAQALYELRSTGSHIPFEKAFLRKDGSRVPVVVGGALLNEEPLLWVSFILDISKRKELEDSLRLSEARFRAIFSNASVGISTTDLKGRLQEFNAPVLRGLGYTPTELKGMSFLDITHPDDLAVDQDLFTKLAAGQRDRYHVEKRYVRKDGQVIWGRLHVSLVRGPGGEPQFTVALMEDITARKESQVALEESEARYRSLVELSPDAILVHTGGRYIFTNPAGLRLFGAADAEDLLGRRVLELVHPDSLETVRRPVDVGKRLDLREVKILRLDGQTIEVEVTATPIQYQGQPAIQVVLRDITERKRAEEALRERETRLTSLFAAAPMGIGLVVDRVITQVNQRLCQMTGYAPEELLGKSSRLLYPTQEDFDYVGQEKYRQIEEEGLGTVETRWQRKDGAIIDILLSSAPLIPGDTSLGMTFTALDITERKRAEAALQESETLFRGLFESMAEGVVLHEIIYDEGGAARDFRILTANPAYAAHTGLIPEQVQGRLGSEVYGIGEAPYLETFARVARTGASETFETYFAPLQRHFHISVTSSKPGHFVTVFEDITVRKKMEETLRRAHNDLEVRVEERTAALRLAYEHLLQEIDERQQVEDRLRDSEARFTAFMEHLPGLAVMRDMEGHYLYANLAWKEIMGLEHGTWQGKTLAEIWAPEPAAELQKLDFQIVSSGEPIEQVEVQALADGPHHFLTKRFPIRDADGLPYMVGAIAIDVTDRQRAEQQVAETGRLYRVLSQVNEAIMRGRDQETLFEQVCRIAVEEGLFCMAWVGLTDPVVQKVLVVAKYGFDEGYLDNLGISIREGEQGQGPTGTAIRENRYDICNDFATDPRMEPWREQAMSRGYRSSGAFPLHIGDKIVGAIGFYAPRPGFFTAKEIALLSSLAANLSFALESLDRENKRCQAEEALKVSEGRLRYLAEQLLSAQENERKRLASELHDELGHALLALKLHLSSIEKKLSPEQEDLKMEIRSQLNYIHEVIQEVRRLYHDLSPGDVEDLGLTKALRNLINDFAGHIPQITWRVDLVDLEGLFSLPVQTIIYRIMQEALTNIGKHAHPDAVTIAATKEPDQVHFVVQDNGTGFNVKEILSRCVGRGLGLAAMEERLSMVGGSLEIQSREQEGTRLSFTIPVLPEGGEQ
jgi:PAS domain S-box-containing protein